MLREPSELLSKVYLRRLGVVDVRGSGQRGLVLLQLPLIMKRLFSLPCMLSPPLLLLPGKKWVNVVNAVEEISLLLSRGGFRGHRQVHRVQIQCLIQCLSLSQGHLSWVDVC